MALRWLEYKIQSTTNSILFKDLYVTHTIKKGLKNSYITISKEAQVQLKTPKVSHSFVLNLLNEKESWIRKKLHQHEQHPPMKINLEDEVLLFGEVCSIDLQEASPLRDKLQKMKVSSRDNILKCYNSYYKEYAKNHIIPRVEYFAQIMDLKYSEIKFRKMKSRWGSCSSKKVLTFNTELIKVKKELIDYVVVHELAHLEHMNHSKDFHTLVERYFLDSKNYRKELKNIQIPIF